MKIKLARLAVSNPNYYYCFEKAHFWFSKQLTF